jgi:hypothetical protein
MTGMRIVPRSEWQDLADRFTRQYRAALGTVHWIPASEPETIARGVALQSIRLAERPPSDFVRVAFLDGPRIRVDHPRAIRVEETERGAERALEIESAENGLLRLAFRAAALPEELDGMAPSELRARAAAEGEPEECPPAA